MLGEFYFGAGDGRSGLKTLSTDLGAIDAREMSSFPVGEGIDLRVGRYGPYVEGPAPEDGDGATRRANVPDDLPPDELTVGQGRGAARQPGRRRAVLGTTPTPACRSSPRTAASAPTSPRCCPRTRPRRPSRAPPRSSSRCPSTRSRSSRRVQLLDLPRIVGTDADGAEITAQNGRYGPYLKKGTDSRSLASEDQIFDITLDEAMAIYAQPKQRGRGAANPPLKELGNDPVSGQPVVVKDGRFGAYVTDGEYNATLRKDDTVESITLERAAELLAERRERGPAKKAGQEGREEGRRQEDGGEEDRPPRRPRRRRRRRRRPRQEVLTCRRDAPDRRP